MEALLQELILKVYNLNKTTKHHLFLDFSGHIDSITIYYYKNGWSEDKTIIYLGNVYLDRETAEIGIKELLKKLDELGKGDE